MSARFLLIIVGCLVHVATPETHRGSLTWGRSGHNNIIIYDHLWPTCYKYPASVAAAASGASDEPDTFHVDVYDNQVWGFRLMLRRTDKNEGWGQDRITISWAASFSADDRGDLCAPGGYCQNFFFRQTCTCYSGYEGTQCTEINECVSSPCQNGGNCVDQINMYSCVCVPGFAGTLCQIDINECASVPCQNGGNCVDGINIYSCVCSAGFTGKNCEIDIDECASNPCQNDGTCVDQINMYSCVCDAGFTGENCEIDIDECASDPCQNGGNCTDYVNEFECICEPGFNGTLCDIDIDECAPGYCQNDANCTDLIDEYICTCHPGYTDFNCETDIDECESQPCLNGGTCVDLVNEYECLCVPGYIGENCSIDVNECQPQPCRNRGYCVDKINDYECLCHLGYTDKNCSTDIDECSSGPCENGAICTDLIYDYNCDCKPGYRDKNCNTNINDCLPEPCVNGGTCVDQVNDYNCLCKSGFTGKNCSTDKCSREPCKHGATCIDISGGHICNCAAGYKGITCETEIDECSKNPCRNNATCVDLVNNYNCSCLLGFTGKNCSEVTHVCGSRTCSEFAKCFLTNHTYSCACQGNFEGDGYFCTPFCTKAEILNADLNQSLTFEKTSVGETTSSVEHCPDGRHVASAQCIYESPSASSFGIINAFGCIRSLLSSVERIQNMTAAEISSTIAFYNLATKQQIKITENKVEEILSGLEEIYTVSKQEKISPNTMYNIMEVVEQLESSFGKLNFSKRKRKRQRTLEVLLNMSENVELPGNETTFTLETDGLTLQVVKPSIEIDESSRMKASDVTFSPARKLRDVLDEPVELMLPGEIIDKAASTIAGGSYPQISFLLFNNDALFSSINRTNYVISARIENFHPVSTSESLDLSYKYEKSLQSIVPFSNGTSKEIVTRTQCSVWDPNQLRWVPDGCELVTGSSPPRCKCYKLANFAMLVDTKILPSAFAMSLATYVGLSLSAICLAATICIYTAIPKLKSRKPTTFLVNICSCLLVVCVLFLVGGNQSTQRIPCYILTCLLHYFLLATWFWMTSNAYNMYTLFVKVLGVSAKIPKVAAMVSYLAPLVIVAINYCATFIGFDIKSYKEGDILFQSMYKSRHICWLRLYSLYYGFLLPVGILLLFNVYFFTATLAKITCLRKTIQSTAAKRSTKEDFVRAVAMIVVMGLTWVFGFLMLLADNVWYRTVMAWLFTIFNSTQGISIFFLNCIRNKEVRNMWLPCKRTEKKVISTTFGKSTPIISISNKTTP